MDLTPYYPFEEDVIAFHRHCSRHSNRSVRTCGIRASSSWCDEYFFLTHRNEARGVGGLFFDDLDEPGFETCFAYAQAVGDAFVPAYVPIVARRKDHHWGERERAFQCCAAAATSNSTCSMTAAPCSG